MSTEVALLAFSRLTEIPQPDARVRRHESRQEQLQSVISGGLAQSRAGIWFGHFVSHENFRAFTFSLKLPQFGYWLVFGPLAHSRRRNSKERSKLGVSCETEGFSDMALGERIAHRIWSLSILKLIVKPTKAQRTSMPTEP